MSKQTLFLTCLSLLVTLGGFAQSMNGTVVGIISLGTQDYCFISEDGTSNVYKTSPYTAGELQAQDEVDLRRTRIQNQVEVTADPLSTQLFAMLEIPQSGASIYYPDMSRMPVLVGDILFFEDEAHITEVHDMMTLFLDDETYDKETDVKLDEIEDNEYASFTSFRNHFNQVYNPLHGVFTESEIETMEKADFINDEIHKTFFNKYRFMGVGNEIYYLHDINMTLVIDKDDSETLALLEMVSVAQDGDGYDVLDIDLPVMTLRKSKKIKFKNPFHATYDNGDGKGIGIVNGSLSYQTIPDFGGFPCELYKKQLAVPELWETVTTSDTTYQNEYWHSSMTLTITWGDGTPDQVVTNYQGQYIIHDYPQGIATIWYPTTKMSFINANGTTTDVFDGNNVPAGHQIEFQTSLACTDENAEAWDGKVSGNWKMTTKIWTYHNWLGHQVGSRTWSYKNEGGWSLKRSKIKTVVSGIYRNTDCIQQETKSGDKYNNNSKKVEKTKNKLWSHYSIANGDVTSYHTLNSGSTSISLSMVLNPCQ